MRLIITLIFLFNSWLFSADSTSSWNWHQQFPWVYNDAESDWHYWRAGTDGQFYLWKDKDQTWYRFDAANSKWISTAWDSYFSNSNSSNNKDDSSKDSSWDGSSKDSSKDQTGSTSNSLTQSVSVNGVPRQYLLYVPTSYNGTSQVPLLLNFHGYGGTSSGHMYSADMRSLADKENFILVYPQGSLNGGYPHWNASPPGSDNKSTADDTGFAEAMITSISSSYQIDATRIYACGYSNGGMMSYFLGASMSDKIAAIGSMSGTMLDGNPIPSNPVPMINIHGTADSILPYSGGDGSTSTVNTLSYWAEQNGASSTPVINMLNSGSLSVEKSVYSDSNGTAWVEHYKVIGGGHVWIDLNINGSNANQLIWDFFSKHNLNGPISTE
jgi:polyhydroxybutyrate depolymerase